MLSNMDGITYISMLSNVHDMHNYITIIYVLDLQVWPMSKGPDACNILNKILESLTFNLIDNIYSTQTFFIIKKKSHLRCFTESCSACF